MSLRRRILPVLAAFSVISALFSAEPVLLSPVPGEWSNPQMLVIDGDDSSFYTYSTNGSDPLVSGFAYDGPVLLAAEGDVVLRVAKFEDGRTWETEVRYSVVPDGGKEPYSGVIGSFSGSGMMSYTAGTEFSFPEPLEYSFGMPPDSFVSGGTVSCSEKNMISRYVPCTVLDRNSGRRWRFMISMIPREAGVYTRRSVPFTVTDWNLVTFTDPGLIYRIDSGYWQQPDAPVVLDRTSSHMVSWQSVAYEPGNPVEFFVLPPKPSVKGKPMEGGGTLFTIDGDDSYMMRIAGAGGDSGLYKEIGADTFYGDRTEGEFRLELCVNSVPQGTVTVPYSVDKRPPPAPGIVSDAKSFYSRRQVSVSVTGDGKSDLFYAVDGPFLLDAGAEKVYTPESPELMRFAESGYRRAVGGRVRLTLDPGTGGAVFYRVRAYSSAGGNTGRVSAYSVIIDQYNYYFDSSSGSDIEDGTAEHPYRNFSDCVASVNAGRSACLRIRGSVQMPEGKTVLLSNCSVIGTDGACLVFPAGGSLVIKSAGLSMEDCRISAEGGASGASVTPVLKLEKSVLDMRNCEVTTDSDGSALFVEAYSSVVDISGSVISVASQSYASAVSSVNSRISVVNSAVAVSSRTAVALSATGGALSLSGNTMRIAGSIGRIAELFGVEADIDGNTFSAEFEAERAGVVPVHADGNTVLKEGKNSVYGF